MVSLMFWRRYLRKWRRQNVKLTISLFHQLTFRNFPALGGVFLLVPG